MTIDSHRFDADAHGFDDRAGLPPAACDTIALAVVQMTGLQPGGLLLEIGAGTGQIGYCWCGLPLKYAGFDSSPEMLDVFARRCRAAGRRAPLFRGDASTTWAIEDGSVDAFFSSRAIHLLPLEGTVGEVFRTASPAGGWLVLGRVDRRDDSVRARLRREMREQLRRLGYAPNEGRNKERALLDACRGRGAIPFEPVVAATWQTADRPLMVLESWRNKAGLAGLDVPETVKDGVLSELRRWARERFGELEEEHGTEDQYVLRGVRLPAGAGKTVEPFPYEN